MAPSTLRRGKSEGRPATVTSVRQSAARTTGRRLLARLGQSLVVLWAAFTVSYLILFLLPGDPVAIMLNNGGEQGAVDPAQAEALRAEYNLDKPLVVQYAIALGKALTFDLGTSIQTGQPVTAAIAQALPLTAQLTGAAIVLAVVAGVSLAVAATYSQRRWLRNLLLSAPSLGISIPSFWLGLVLLQFLSFRHQIFPAMGSEGIKSLVLPAITLAVPTAATIAQVLARSLAGAWNQPYISAIRAKGLSRLGLLTRHALHNAAIPALTMTGVIVGNLLAGSVVTETVFSRDGVGRLAQASVGSQDIPVVQGVVLLAALIFVSVNLLVDLVYPLLDPRLRTQAPACTPSRSIELALVTAQEKDIP
ncbi:ABC transporter permease [Saxibacter everestensis]|uniref:ABC transporter permease n=1 Tax=Saxibacter everestensis TaxID=2909229 RepID=A0ABY8QQJ9_9MICO|nr:ABC transporter permease [Brevibacteriaceae bacterium ZFBP1038]